MFVSAPTILMQDGWLRIGLTIASTKMGVFFLAAALKGHFFGRLERWPSAHLFGGSLCSV